MSHVHVPLHPCVTGNSNVLSATSKCGVHFPGISPLISIEFREAYVHVRPDYQIRVV